MQVTIYVPDEYRDRVLAKMTGLEWKKWLLETIRSKVFDNEIDAIQSQEGNKLDTEIKNIGITIT